MTGPSIGQPTVQRAAFLVRSGGGELRVTAHENRELLRAASLLKPLLFWAAGHLEPFRSSPELWEQLARAGVTVSANEPTVRAWEECGQERLVGWLAERTGVRFEVEAGGERQFGRMLVTASGVARAYGALAAADDELAARLLDWMRGVAAEQTFGVRDVLAERLGAQPGRVAVKCGWFTDSDEPRIRTHAAALAEIAEGRIGTVVLSAVPVEEPTRRSYAALYEKGGEVLPIHEAAAGPVLRAATAQALSDLGF